VPKTTTIPIVFEMGKRPCPTLGRADEVIE
jgi:hypothetical protein